MYKRCIKFLFRNISKEYFGHMYKRLCIIFRFRSASKLNIYVIYKKGFAKHVVLEILPIEICAIYIKSLCRTMVSRDIFGHLSVCLMRPWHCAWPGVCHFHPSRIHLVFILHFWHWIQSTPVTFILTYWQHIVWHWL